MSTYVLCLGSSAACEKVMLADTTIEDKRKETKSCSMNMYLE